MTIAASSDLHTVIKAPEHVLRGLFCDRHKKKEAPAICKRLRFVCLGDLTRTSDLLVPNQVRYQLRHTQMPSKGIAKIRNFFRIVSFLGKNSQDSSFSLSGISRRTGFHL